MAPEILVLGGLALLIGLAIRLADLRLPQRPESPAERVNQLLPQSQCGQCGYPGCRPYAEAIIAGTADIDQCAPGGDRTVTALANLLGRAVAPVNPVFGNPGPAQVAEINESACIGCTLCIAACPVDAIVGAAQHTHTVLRDACTGCELCIPPCPVDCIALRLRQPQQAAA
jgi:electron transport complex protein RnfB